MFKKSSLGSRRNFPGGRRDAGAFQELRQLTAEDNNEPHAVEKPAPEPENHEAPCPKVGGDGPVCTCPPEPDHDHDIATAEGEGMPPIKNNCKACFPPSEPKTYILA